MNQNSVPDHHTPSPAISDGGRTFFDTNTRTSWTMNIDKTSGERGRTQPRSAWLFVDEVLVNPEASP